MIGTDYPFNFHDRMPVARIESCGFDAETVGAARPRQRRVLSRPEGIAMTSPWIAALRSVALVVPDVDASERFYTEVWGLETVAHERPARSTCAALAAPTTCSRCTPATHAALRDVTFQGRSDAALDDDRSGRGGGGRHRASRRPRAVDEPGGGRGVTVRDADGRVLRVVHGDARHADPPTKAATARSGSRTWC